MKFIERSSLFLKNKLSENLFFRRVVYLYEKQKSGSRENPVEIGCSKFDSKSWSKNKVI